MENLLPFLLSSEPTKAEIGLYMFCTLTAPVSPELSHEAAMDVQKFSSQVTVWQFKGHQVSDAGPRSQVNCADRLGPAHGQGTGALHSTD